PGARGAAGRGAARARGPEPEGQGGTRRRTDVGARAHPACRAVRDGRSRAGAAHRHRGTERAAPGAAARHLGRRHRPRRRDPGRGAGVSVLPLRALRAEPAALIRAARLADVPELEALMAPFVATGDLLPRSRYDLCRHIKEYVVAEADAQGRGSGGGGRAIVACGSLKLYSGTLAEVAGLAGRDDWQGRGVGRAVAGIGRGG